MSSCNGWLQSSPNDEWWNIHDGTWMCARKCGVRSSSVFPLAPRLFQLERRQRDMARTRRISPCTRHARVGYLSCFCKQVVCGGLKIDHYVLFEVKKNNLLPTTLDKTGMPEFADRCLRIPQHLHCCTAQQSVHAQQ